jgi:hypothetical protein
MCALAALLFALQAAAKSTSLRLQAVQKVSLGACGNHKCITLSSLGKIVFHVVI